MHDAAIHVRPGGSPPQLLQSGRLAGVEWRDLVALARIETARKLTLCLPWPAHAAERLYPPALAASFI